MKSSRFSFELFTNVRFSTRRLRIVNLHTIYTFFYFAERTRYNMWKRDQTINLCNANSNVSTSIGADVDSIRMLSAIRKYKDYYKNFAFKNNGWILQKLIFFKCFF